MLEQIIMDAVTVLVAAAAGYFFGRVSMATRLEVLRLMRVVEKVLAGSGNEVLKAALMTLFVHTKDYVSDRMMAKVEQIVEGEASKMKPLVNIARRIFGGDREE